MRKRCGAAFPDIKNIVGSGYGDPLSEDANVNRREGGTFDDVVYGEDWVGCVGVDWLVLAKSGLKHIAVERSLVRAEAVLS